MANYLIVAQHHDLPILVAGEGAGTIKGGRDHRFAKGTPLTKLHLTLMEKFGIAMERFGYSTGPLNLLSDVY